jgi:Secretion system C-terminal sorting domain
MKKIFLSLSLVISLFSFTCFAQDNMEISGAGSTEVNGIYTAVMKYEMGIVYSFGSFYLYPTGTHWIIGTTVGEDPSGSGVYYSVLSSSFFPTGLTFTDNGTLGEGTPPSVTDPALPVEISTFLVHSLNGIVEINWETTLEINNYGFEIQRLSEGADWKKIAFIHGHGNSNSPKTYSYTDATIFLSGQYFYRLKQIDIDGKYEYSDVVEVKIGVPNNYELHQNYPNPFNPSTIIKYSIPKQSSVRLTVFDVLGSEIITLVNKEQLEGNYEIELDGTEFSSGIYFYRISAGDPASSAGQVYVETKKMILLK